jgi:hypothetical protein
MLACVDSMKKISGVKTVVFKLILASCIFCATSYGESSETLAFVEESQLASDSVKIDDLLPKLDSLGLLIDSLMAPDSMELDFEADSTTESIPEKLRRFAVFSGLGIQFNTSNLSDAFTEAGDSLRNRRDAVNPETNEYRRTPFDRVLLSSPINITALVRDSTWGLEVSMYYEYGRSSSTITSLLNPVSEVLTLHLHHYSFLPALRFYIPPAVFSVTGYSSVYVSWGPMISLRRSKLSWQYGEITADKSRVMTGTQLKIGGRFFERKAWSLDGEFYYTTHTVPSQNIKESLFTQDLSTTTVNTWEQNGTGMRLLLGYAWH